VLLMPIVSLFSGKHQLLDRWSFPLYIAFVIVS